MKSLSAREHRKFYRKSIVEQLAVSAQVEFIYMGFFDCSHSIFVDWWFGRGSKLPQEPGPEEVLDIIRKIDLAVTESGNCAASRSAIRSDPGYRLDKAHWVQFDECLVGVGSRVGNLVPIVAVVGSEDESENVDNAVLQIGMSYVAQELHDILPQNKAQNSDAIQTVLSMLAINFAVVDSYGNIDYSTDLSPKWLEEGGSFEINARRLSGRTTKIQKMFHHALRIATSPVRLPSIVSLDGQGRAKIAVIMPVEKSSPPRALVIFEGENDDPMLRDHLLKLSGLTNSERRITHHILEGKTLAETAEETNLSLSTVRSYMKGIFAKTSTHRQSELITRFQHAVPRVKFTPATKAGPPEN